MNNIRFRLNTIILLFILLLLPLLNFDVFLNYSTYQKNEDINKYLDLESLRTADSWSEPFIHITGANWTITNNSKAWCSGAGTWNDPYVIENVSITADKDSIAILIEDSEEYFTLRNCTVKTNLTTIYSTGPYAIHLINTNNSQITENSLSQNYAGVKLENSHNNTIGENIINTNNTFINHGHLMFLKDSDNNLIINNIVINSNNRGIVLYTNSNYNIITNNTINNVGSGVFIDTACDYNNVTDNNLNNNNGIDLFGTNNLIANNTINNPLYGISIYYSSKDNMITGNIMSNCGFIIYHWPFDPSNFIDNTNLINGKLFYYYKDQVGLNSENFTDAAQIALDNCKDSIIENLDLSSSSIGVNLYNCNNVTTANINSSYNYYGVKMENCNNITIFRSNMSNTYYGIYMDFCNDNNISNNLMNENYRGISFQRSDYNLISKNNISKNIDRALSLYGGSEENIISHNNISDTEDDGIYLKDRCSNNTIFDNKVENSELNGIVLEDDCDFNNITGNLIEDNSFSGILLLDTGWTCDYNNITNNTIIGNLRGIYLDGAEYNTVSYNILIDNSFSGIEIDNSATFDNIIKNNLLFGSGFHLTGYLNYLSSEDIDTSNKVNNKPIYIYANQLYLDSSDFGNAGQVFLLNCNNSIISNLDLSNGTTGLYLHSSFNNTIENINATYNKAYGIYALYSNNNTFLRNDCSFSYYDGIGVRDSSSNNITSNILNNCSRGILISWNSEYNIISNNLICNNSNSGIYLDETWNNSIKNNSIKDNIYGVYFFREVESNKFTENLINNNTYGVLINSYSPFNKYNLFYNNSFANPSGINAEDNGNLNMWDNGVIGNFWHDYVGTDGDGNGIGDTPYNISGSSNSKDNFPLMEWPFKLIISNPGPFSLSSPDAGTPDDDGQFTLDWTLSSGADNYTLYRGDSWFSTYNGSQTILVNEQNIFSFSENLSINGTYYYRVLAKNDTGSTYSDAQCIWIEVEIPPISPPEPFSLSSPDAGTPDDDGQFTLDWTLSSGADNYTLYMSLNVPFNTFDGSQTILVHEENVNTFLVSLTQNGTYYFRVCARNSAGEEYSDLGPIAIIVQIEPEPKNGDGDIDPGIPGYNIFLLIGIIFLGIIFFKNRIQHYRT